MLIKVRKSKTIQFDQKELLIPIFYLANRKRCAMFWVKKHFCQVIVLDDSPAFQVAESDSDSGFRPLQYTSFQATIQFMACANLDPNDYSSYSPHWGGCTFLAM